MDELRMVTPRAKRDERGVERKRFEYPHGALPTEDAHLRGGEAGVSLLAETHVVLTPYRGNPDGVPGVTAPRKNDDVQDAGTEARALDCCLAPPVGLPQHPDEHRSERPILLAVDRARPKDQFNSLFRGVKLVA